ncbi:hypothetical protein NFI96_027086, partial [Prochilodus magdalenae]
MNTCLTCYNWELPTWDLTLTVLSAKSRLIVRT